MFGFHKSKIYRSHEGCCICKTKSSSSRFTDSSRYEETFRLCFGLSEDRVGDICNACVLLVKRWKKLPKGSKKNWNHVVDARAGPGFKLTKPKKMKNSDGKKKNKLKRLHKFKRQNSDAHSTTSSMSPSQSPSYESDDGSDIESKQRRPTPSVFSFLDRSYWKSPAAAPRSRRRWFPCRTHTFPFPRFTPRLYCYQRPRKRTGDGS
ncbi:SIN3-HDAC complex-associated factor-like isoform X2 [Oncorhynchus clarkii lewisi]|uniref:SIN3-HDAC complex-associated factor-like isoform X2 n=1 Tax=Oncorhynchus clarkii lewisi TaxID=490388 RepID=UPI0039B8D3D4